MSSIEVFGAQLDYVEQGRGEPLVFVHGSINDRRSWGQQIGPFAERYRVIAYTRRHHHGSEDPDSGRPLSVTAAAEDLLALIDALAGGRAHLAGSSFGAFTALRAATTRPQAVRTLVLGEPPIGYLLSSDPQTRAMWDEFVANAVEPSHEQARAGDAAAGLRMFVDSVIGKGALDLMPEPARQMMMDNASTLGIEELPLERFGAQDAANLKMPMLLVSGEQTPEMFNAITSKLRALLPDAEHAVIPNASHGMHGQNPAAYNEAVLEFLARRG